MTSHTHHRAVFQIGEVSIERIEEQCGLGFAPDFLFPDWTPEALERHRKWMVPDCFSEADNRFIASIHTWVVRTARHTILIDSCSGNDKERPLIERFHRRSLPFLDRLRAANVEPEHVDYVLCTHLHADHCGWNTRLHNGRWVPTFPNARYVFSRAEYLHWSGPAGKEGFNAGVFEDSVLPVIESGQSELIDGEGEIGAGLIVRPTPGHCAGHVAFQLRSGGDEALFSGDVMHQPVQVFEPSWNSRFCEDAELARQSRQWVLQHCVNTGATLFPAHFAGGFAGHVHEHHGGFGWQFSNALFPQHG